MKNKLSELRKEILRSQKIENKNIKSILKWLKKRDKVNNMKVSKTSVNELKDWYFKKNGNLFHKSGQFFSVEGVKVDKAKREVRKWDQLIFNQPHGGVLAFLTRETSKYGVEFLLCLRSEPGDANIKFCPSFSATKSNMNKAHGGKRTELYDQVIKSKGSEIIAISAHNEEGARFWRKRNENWIVKIKDPHNKVTKKDHFVWANLWQIKKLCLEECVINPYVKTILFMI